MLEKNASSAARCSASRRTLRYDLFPTVRVPIHGNAFETIFQELGATMSTASAGTDDPREVHHAGVIAATDGTTRCSRSVQAMDNPSPSSVSGKQPGEDQAATMTIMANHFHGYGHAPKSLHGHHARLAIARARPDSPRSYMHFTRSIPRRADRSGLGFRADSADAADDAARRRGQYKGLGHEQVMGREFESLAVCC